MHRLPGYTKMKRVDILDLHPLVSGPQGPDLLPLTFPFGIWDRPVSFLCRWGGGRNCFLHTASGDGNRPRCEEVVPAESGPGEGGNSTPLCSP